MTIKLRLWSRSMGIIPEYWHGFPVWRMTICCKLQRMKWGSISIINKVAKRATSEKMLPSGLLQQYVTELVGCVNNYLEGNFRTSLK